MRLLPQWEIRSRLRGQCDRRRCRPAIPGVADRHRVTGLFGQGQLLQLNVAGRLLTVDLGDHVVSAQPGRGGRATRGHRLTKSPSGSPACSAAAGGLGTVCNPKNAWVTRPVAMISSATRFARSTGMAKPSPMLPPPEFGTVAPAVGT